MATFILSQSAWEFANPVRARVCVCVCVCVYTLPPVGFFRLHDICDIREKFGSTIFCCEYFLGASAKFLHLYL